VTGDGASSVRWLNLIFARGVMRRSAIVALIVGSVLNLINQGDALFAGGGVTIWKLLLTYCVPYCVATYGAVTARMEFERILRQR
jgi:hypothetical protein